MEDYWGVTNVTQLVLCGIYLTTGIVLLFVFVMLCALSENMRYRVKFTFFIIASALAAGLWIPFMLFRIGSWRNALVPARCVVTVAKIIGMNFHFRGKENIVKDSGCIVLINHQSSLDLCVLGELWLAMDNCTVISKKEILYLGPFGLACWLWGTLFIDRKNVGKSCQIINATVESIRLAKRRLLLFPEGHRHSGSSYITVLPPIPTVGMTKDDLPKLMEQAYKVMNKTFVESSTECLEEQIQSLKCE
ncbi:PREDICTED: 1-acyl-sn-glycerol-3-phosphate acyltransferase alpha isoform X3 [Acromyrmex echinatior]|uniref:1-acyl-sn-glycerol-3-phosphate acyltransferase alpha isoform X3 n=1 Tax=Acromyrmex echinatior TaxID=103372 RepID=UPI000580D7C6|nr:PREDICTED: 1-acyl-sn-glycerol-3-phosphate acyltransferase alpha isoform X3 [Acromyrmex echinatior]